MSYPNLTSNLPVQTRCLIGEVIDIRETSCRDCRFASIFIHRTWSPEGAGGETGQLAALQS